MNGVNSCIRARLPAARFIYHFDRIQNISTIENGLQRSHKKWEFDKYKYAKWNHKTAPPISDGNLACMRKINDIQDI